MACEIETLDAFDAAAATGSVARCALQGLDLRDRVAALASTDVTDALFLGCQVPAETAEQLGRRGALVFPRLPRVPFDPYRGALYTADELFAGLTAGYPTTPDGRVYDWTLSEASTLLDASLAKSLHDHSITDALFDALPDAAAGVGIMGGHAVARGSDDFLRTARLGRALAASGRLVVTGGGPGAMEAANLGASFGGTDADLDAACAELATVPSFRDGIEPWARVALDVRERYRCTRQTFGVPTWFYGHEPPNVFGTGIAKYFDNAIREDVLLRLCAGGVIFMPGAAGTVQEIFQAVTPAYYAAESVPIRPLVFVGLEFWTETVPAWPLLSALASGRAMAGHLHLVDDVADVVDALA